MEITKRTGYYNKVNYKHIIMDEDEFIADEEIGVVYRVIPELNHGCSEEVELTTSHDEFSQVFGIVEKLTINQFKNLGGVL